MDKDQLSCTFYSYNLNGLTSFENLEKKTILTCDNEVYQKSHDVKSFLINDQIVLACNQKQSVRLFVFKEKNSVFDQED